MGDPFEGHYTKAIADQEEEHIQTLKSNSEFVALHSNNMDIALDLARKSFRLNTLELPQQLKEYYFISCWHMNEEESPAMWKLYTSQNESICIRSNYKIFARLLPEQSFLGCVKYIDYRRDRFDTNDFLNYIVHKRKSFEHEREIRAVIYKYEPCPFELVGERRTDRRHFCEPYLAIAALRCRSRSRTKIWLERACPTIPGKRRTHVVIETRARAGAVLSESRERVANSPGEVPGLYVPLRDF